MPTLTDKSGVALTQADVDGLDLSVEQQASMLDELVHRIEELTQERNALVKRVAAYQLLETEMTAKDEEQEETIRRNRHVEQKLLQMTQDEKKSRVRLDELEEQLVAFSGVKSNLETMILKLKQANGQFEKSIKDQDAYFNVQLRDMARENTKLTEAYDKEQKNLQAQMEALQDDNVIKAAEIREIGEKYRVLLLENERVRRALADVEEELLTDESLARQDVLPEVAPHLSLADELLIAEAPREKDQLLKELVGTREENAAFKATIQQLQSAKKDLSRRNGELDTAIATLKQKLESQHAQLDKEQAQYSELRMMLEAVRAQNEILERTQLAATTREAGLTPQASLREFERVIINEAQPGLAPQTPTTLPNGESRGMEEAPARKRRAPAHSRLDIESLKADREAIHTFVTNQPSWLNSAFQASAEAYATSLDVSLNDLRKLMNDLDKHGSDLRLILNQPDVDSEQQAALMSYLSDLEFEREAFGQLIDTIEQSRLRDMIEQAKKAAHDIHQSSSIYKVSFGDYLLSQKEEYLNEAARQSFVRRDSETSVTRTEADDESLYKTRDRVRPDYFREHIIDFDDKNLGRFIEERSRDNQPGAVPSVKMTVTSFPDATDPNARLMYSMAMVTQLLAGLKEAPTARNPLILRGVNEEELACLFSALKVFGETSAHMRFGHEAIHVESTTCSTENVRQRADEFFATNETKFVNLAKLKDEIKQLTTEKFGTPEGAPQAFINRVEHFKEKIRQATDSSKDEIASDHPVLSKRP